MNQKNALIYCLFFSFCLSKGFSQTLISNTLDEVFITSSRFELSKDYIGRVIDKITSDDIQKNTDQSLAQLLNRMTGITVNGSYGQSGSVLSTYVRGGQNRQVLILIDGIPANDPSQIENNFDLNLMSLEYIESIEVLKGPASVLYGTNASTAVINILTKSGLRQPFSVSINATTGTNKDYDQNKIALDDYKTSLAVVGSHKKLNYAGHFSHRSNDGLSAISSENSSDMYDTDRFETNNLQFKLGYTFSNRFTLSGFLNSNRYTSDYDESFGFLDANYHTKNNQLRLGLVSQFTFNKGSVNFNAA